MTSKFEMKNIHNEIEQNKKTTRKYMKLDKQQIYTSRNLRIASRSSHEYFFSIAAKIFFAHIPEDYKDRTLVGEDDLS